MSRKEPPSSLERSMNSPWSTSVTPPTSATPAARAVRGPPAKVARQAWGKVHGACKSASCSTACADQASQ